MNTVSNTGGGVVVRMPPSPTGKIHIGNVRTLLFNYLFAKRHNGRIVFRSEDTDRARSKPEYESAILEELTWLGLEWDEFYRQSDRSALYQNHLETLIEEGMAYLSKEESKTEPGKEVEVVRLKNQNKVITFRDEVRGDISVDTTDLGDFVIARSLTDALYHFTVVVDDFLSGVTHVIRGDDHISNTPRQILIQEALGAPRPIYAHLPLILSPDRSKLSKRHGATSLGEYREQGFLPQAVMNYLALLGWNPRSDQELFSPEELIERFDIEGIQKSGAVFDREKLLWFNREHLRKMNVAELLDVIMDVLPEHLRGKEVVNKEQLSRLLPLIRERVHTITEIRDGFVDGEFSFIFGAHEYEASLLTWKKDPSPESALPRLTKCKELLSLLPEWVSPEEAKAALFDYAEATGRGEVLWPLRIALSGKERSADPFTIISVIGREESLARITFACAKIGG